MSQFVLTSGVSPDADHPLMTVALEDQPINYTSRDVILYALGVGFGSDPRLGKELAYVFERPLLKTLPTLATMLPGPDFPEDAAWDGRQALHLDQRLEMYRPLPAASNLLANQRVIAVDDGGPKQGVRIVVQSDVRLASDETAVFKLVSTLVTPADGAYSRPLRAATMSHQLPTRSPDLSCSIATRVDQALLFRLSGDNNPLHADLHAARAAGFNGPLLHGRCLLGIAGRAILRTICDYDHTLMTGIEAAFVAPAYPGDVVTTDMWQERNIVSFRCSVKDRNTIVVDNGKCTLSA
jgi:acyl dehydratase